VRRCVREFFLSSVQRAPGPLPRALQKKFRGGSSFPKNVSQSSSRRKKNHSNLFQRPNDAKTPVSAHASCPCAQRVHFHFEKQTSRYAMGRPSLDTGGEIAVIDLVAHLYSTQGLRRDLCAVWDKYSAATTDERKQKGFEIVRNYHSQLTRMFRDGTFDQHNTVILLRFVLIFFMRALLIRKNSRTSSPPRHILNEGEREKYEKKKGVHKSRSSFSSNLFACERGGKARYFYAMYGMRNVATHGRP